MKTKHGSNTPQSSCTTSGHCHPQMVSSHKVVCKVERPSTIRQLDVLYMATPTMVFVQFTIKSKILL